MDVGMMWFEKEKITLEEKVQRAVEYYHGKYGVSPNFCLVRLGTLDGRMGGEMQVGDVVVREQRNVLPNHLWIGIEKAGV